MRLVEKSPTVTASLSHCAVGYCQPNAQASDEASPWTAASEKLSDRACSVGQDTQQTLSEHANQQEGGDQNTDTVEPSCDDHSAQAPSKAAKGPVGVESGTGARSNSEASS